MDSWYYAYAIHARDMVLPPLAGLAGGLVSAIGCRELAFAVTELCTSDVPVTAQHVLCHEGIVEAVRAVGPALPVRFGTLFRDAQAAERAMTERYDVLLADLSRLGDKVELGLAVMDHAQPSDSQMEPGSLGPQQPPALIRSEGPGARYLRARWLEDQREHRRRASAESLVQVVDSMVSAFALERRVVVTPTARMAFRATYLVEPSQLVPFKEALDVARKACFGLRFLLSGPWPPYSFVTPPETTEAARLPVRLGWRNLVG